MAQMKTYSEIENELWGKIDKLPVTQEDFILYIGHENGEFVDLLYFGIRNMFEKSLVMVMNDTMEEMTPMDTFAIDLNKKHREHYKSELRHFIIQFGLVRGNYYTFEDILDWWMDYFKVKNGG